VEGRATRSCSRSTAGSRARPRVLPLVALAGAIALAGCGGGGGDGKDRATLVLDFVPNAVHTGIYHALAAGYYEDEGIELEIVEPSATADTLKLVEAGTADLGIADGIDVATQVDQGSPLRAVMALLQRPAGGVIVRRDSGITRPRQLEGQTVGITGVPSDTAVLDSVVSGDGGDPAAVDTVTLGFAGAQALEAGRIDAFTGFVPADGVQVERDGFPIGAFRVDRFGGPAYPGLVVFTTESRIEEDPELVASLVRATARGYEDTLADPESSLIDLVEANPEIDAGIAGASLRAYLPLMRPRGRDYGTFDTGELRAFSRWLLDTGLTEAPVTPDRLATNRFVGSR
jgi:putative hydroxymethylpyrimidine transport system substrate-binding protein